MGISLTTLQEYKSYVGISSTNQDAAISALIPRVSSLVKSICKRSFVDYVDDAKTEIFSGGEKLVLQETPVIQVQSVEMSTNYGEDYTELEAFKNYALDLESGSIVPIQVFGYIPDYWDGIIQRTSRPAFPKRINGYRVTYTAGYETLPEDLKLAVLDLITYYLRNEPAIHSSKAVGANTVQIEYVTNTALPAHIRRVLDLHSANYN